MTKEEQIDDLVEWVISSMDTSELEAYLRHTLIEYYLHIDNHDEFRDNYKNMLEIRGE